MSSLVGSIPAALHEAVIDGKRSSKFSIRRASKYTWSPTPAGASAIRLLMADATTSRGAKSS